MEKAYADISNQEAKLGLMEKEIIQVQKAWCVQKVPALKKSSTVDAEVEVDFKSGTDGTMKNTAVKSTQIELKMHSMETQCDIPNGQTMITSYNDSEHSSCIRDRQYTSTAGKKSNFNS